MLIDSLQMNAVKVLDYYTHYTVILTSQSQKYLADFTDSLLMNSREPPKQISAQFSKLAFKKWALNSRRQHLLTMTYFQEYMGILGILSLPWRRGYLSGVKPQVAGNLELSLPRERLDNAFSWP